MNREIIFEALRFAYSASEFGRSDNYGSPENYIYFCWKSEPGKWSRLPNRYLGVHAEFALKKRRGILSRLFGRKKWLEEAISGRAEFYAYFERMIVFETYLLERIYRFDGTGERYLHPNPAYDDSVRIKVFVSPGMFEAQFISRLFPSDDDLEIIKMLHNHRDLIRLWTLATPSKSYDKTAWMSAQAQLRQQGGI
ncbi:MAG: hypothetical protein AB7E72_12455 [Lysobacterales bacterium]